MDLTSILGVEGVLVEENRETCVMSHVEPTGKKVMGIFLSATGPWVPVVDAEPLLHR